MARFPWLTIAVAAAAAAAAALPGAAAALELSREGLLRGELWRLATGHLVHWSASHALWDVATFLGLGALCEGHSRRQTAGVLALAAPLVSLAVLGVHPELASYRGLSALDVTLFALLALQLAGRLGLALGALLAAKLGWEAATGAALFVGEPGADAVLVPAAHLAGAAAALAGGALALPAALGTRAPALTAALRSLPNLLSALRLALAPLLLVLAWTGRPAAFLALLTVSLLSDVCDGWLARRLGQETPLGTRLDSWGDLATYATVPLCAWWLWPDLLRREAPWVMAAIAAYALPIALGWLKYRRLTSYHTFGAKLSAVLMGAGALLLFAGGSPLPFHVATVVLILAELEEIAITATLPTWCANVPSLRAAQRRRLSGYRRRERRYSPSARAPAASESAPAGCGAGS